MKKEMPIDCRGTLEALAEALNDLMADLEDSRDEAQDLLDEEDSVELRRYIARLDALLSLLTQAADRIDSEE